MHKLVVQIPCYNEEKTLAVTINEIKENLDHIEGISEWEILVINDGSTDKSAQIALELGVSILEIKHNQGLANAFRQGVQKALAMGADIIVNTDADNQYSAKDIQTIINPILKGNADVVIGARDIASIKHFSPLKKLLQKFGSAVLRFFSSTKVADAPSGFRAFSREAALKINVFDNYTYTMETLIQAGAKGLRVCSTPIRVNEDLRKSKLVKNIFSYIFKSMKTTIRMFIVYRPFRFFASLACFFAIAGIIGIGRFLYYYIAGDGNGHIQSLIISAIFLITFVQLLIVAVIGDLLSINRKLLEDIQLRLKKNDLKK